MGARALKGAMKSSVVLFDIDNTLLYTGGAGRMAMEATFAEVFGLESALTSVEFNGKTDRSIYTVTLQLHGIEDRPGAYEQFERRYLEILDRLLPERPGHRKPGIPHLLAALRDAGAALGLATGNFRSGAMRKLQYYGIEEYFLYGGFGDNAEEREALVRDALAQAAAGPDDAVYVIGDTPGDIVSARQNGVFAIGVATGSYRTDDLLAAGAHVTFDDLSDIARVIEMLRSLATRRPLGATSGAE